MDNTQVTNENWEEIKAKGFIWKENIKNWSQHKVTAGEYLMKLKEKKGEENVLVGVPANEQRVPIISVDNTNDMLGVYVRS